MTQDQHSRHATTVVVDGQAIMIEGPSNSGKSSLALQLMAFGAGLIADDNTRLTSDGIQVWASAPETLPHAIEARGIGLVCAELAPPAPLFAVVDMGTTETRRLPSPRQTLILGHKVALLHKVEHAHFPSAILQYVRGRGVLFE